MTYFIHIGLHVLDWWGAQTENNKFKYSFRQLDSNPEPFANEANYPLKNLKKNNFFLSVFDEQGIALFYQTFCS